MCPIANSITYKNRIIKIAPQQEEDSVLRLVELANV